MIDRVLALHESFAMHAKAVLRAPGFLAFDTGAVRQQDLPVVVSILTVPRGPCDGAGRSPPLGQ
jgi:hypothetical protein